MIRTLTTILALTLTAGAVAQETASVPAKVTKAVAALDAWQAQTMCPVSGKKLGDSKEHFVDYEGQRIYVCCAKCVKKVKAAPELTLYKMASVGVAPADAQSKCIVSGKPLKNHDTFVSIGNKRIYTCCEKCASKAEKEPAKYLDALEGRSAQKKCPISGEPVEAFTTIDGFKVGACCEKCIAKIEKDPAPHLAKLTASKVVLEPAERLCSINPKKPGKADIFVTLAGKRHYFCCEKCQAKFMKKALAKAEPAKKGTEAAALKGLGYLGGGR